MFRSRRASSFYRQTKRFDLKFYLKSSNFLLDGQTRQAKSSSQMVNLRLLGANETSSHAFVCDSFFAFLKDLVGT